MANFSPYTYRVQEFAAYEGLSNQNIDAYYNVYTMLAKPKKRNVYKLSLGQLLHYMVDFGIGYNSVCVTAVTNLQKFATGMYVNRHETHSDFRPATVSDLKEKVLDVVREMIRATVKGTSTANDGIKEINTVYPKYIFTLDTSTDFADKLKLLTNHTYVDVTTFNDFAYTSSTTFIPLHLDGYARADDFLMCPLHDHDPHSKMSEAISYSIGVSFRPKGSTMWAGHAGHAKLAQFKHHNYDSVINPIYNPNFGTGYVEVTASANASWEKPRVICEESENKYPDGTITVNGIKQISLRWPGRRYRLFKRTD